jgi:hypothetical protein
MRKEIERFLSNGSNGKLIAELAKQRKEAELFLRLMQEEAGLIVERGTDENGESIYGFVHRTFQEYFAAADVYNRFEQDEDPTIISDFLIEHLHDPHWREVILLLLGKLGRKRATLRLRHILDGKIKSRRSLYNDILRQDLFFVCDCLIDEMDVESDLAEAVVSRVGNLVITSPILRQRTNALEKLGELMQTRQFASLGKRELVRLVKLDTITSKLKIAVTLISSSLEGSEEWELAMQQYEKYAEIQENIRLELLEEKRLVFQRLGLPIEQAIQSALLLYKLDFNESEERNLVRQRLVEIAQRPDLTIEQAIQVAQALSKAEERKFAMQMLVEIAQRPDLTTEQAIQAALSFLGLGYGSEAQKLGLLQLVEIAQRPDLTVEQTIQVAEPLYPFTSEGKMLAIQLLLQVLQRLDIELEQVIHVVIVISGLGLAGERRKGGLARRRLLVITRQLNLTVEQEIQVAQTLYEVSFREKEQKLATQQLLQIAQRPDLTIEQAIQAVQALYRSSPRESEERQKATQLLWLLVQDTSITANQRLSLVTIPISLLETSYKDKLHAIQELHLLLPVEQITSYLETHWPLDYYDRDMPDMPDILYFEEIPDAVAILKQELLPTSVRDIILSILNGLIPQFNKISL